MKRNFFIFILFTIFFSGKLSAQEIESINELIKNIESADDSVKINLLLELSDLYFYNEKIDKAIITCEKATLLADSIENNLQYIDCLNRLSILYYNTNQFQKGLDLLDIAKKIAIKYNYKVELIRIYSNIGAIYDVQSQFEKALSYYFPAKELSIQINDEDKLAASLMNISNVYAQLGKYNDAIPLILDAIKIEQKLDNKARVANAFNNLGNIYYYQNDFEKALEYYLKANEIAVNTTDLRVKAVVLSNIADAYINLKNYDLALSYLENSLKIFENLKDSSSIAMLYNYFGNIYLELNKLDMAKSYFKKQLNLYSNIRNYEGISSLYQSLGDIDRKENNNQQALKNYHKSLDYAQRSKSFETLKSIYKSIFTVFNDINQTDSALKYIQLYYAMKDSSFTIEKEKHISNLQTQFDTKTKEKEIELQNLKIEKQEQRLVNQRLIIFLFAIILLLIVLFFIFLYRQYLSKKRSNEILIAQQNRITSSLQYASKIQSALLTPCEFINQLFPENFILYIPKDIVSGDFYWFYEKENRIYFAIADCTGHGVPGAFMSILGISLLNEIISKLKEPDTNQILDELRNEIINALRQTGGKEEAKDGIEISLCSVDKIAQTIQFSGTSQFIYFVHKGEIKRLKGNKMPIGFHQFSSKAFSLIEFNYALGDQLYLLTDGFIDQFSASNKKYTGKRFQDLIKQIHDENLQKQKEILLNDFDVWKGKHEQIDDVLILGLKL